MNGITIHQGDALTVLRNMPEESVHCVVTSPPYWGLRDYGVAGQLGLESTPQAYVHAMVEIFAEVRRVLHSDGTCWLNLGDCYASGAGAVGDCPGGGEQGARWRGYRGSRDGDHAGMHKYLSDAMGPMTQPNRMPIEGLKPKDLVGVPWRVAFALQQDGWWLRSDIIWSKPNPMPESVQDRPTKAHEYLFLLTKGERYHYDSKAIAERTVSDHLPGNISHKGLTAYLAGDEHHRTKQGLVAYAQKRKEQKRKDQMRHLGKALQSGFAASSAHDETFLTRNKRSVWTVNPQPFTEAHFATFPEDLIRPCILAGCPPGGTVLDPFFGSGTTGLVARAQGCKCIGIELNPAYIEIAVRRLAQEHLEFA